VLASVFALSSALTLTVITARHRAWTSGPDARDAERALREYGGSPLVYHNNGRAVAAVVFIWPGFLATVASTYLLWKSYAHNDKLGPLSAHARKARDVDGAVSMDTTRPHTPTAGDVEMGVRGGDAPVTEKREPAEQSAHEPHTQHTTMAGQMLDPNVPRPDAEEAVAAALAPRTG